VPSRVFALHVVACGHVPSESGRAQAERSASKKLIHETGIRRTARYLVLAEQMEWIESRKASAPQTEK
jgi:hypothetical protein